ncbi:DUF2268 domain-containing putative Zn-dependent protease [Paraflavitalea sp. CAU 1676]|uniref:DUF2268 domain-containing putative Zn-dependent protease n=1 Tax=Paraflavitalea sp. CAU 1676 TaxID=3032598 RepID=UPI0023DBD149|nr:DUF2268 domain-containing putative Zn-dependent protease [Paraflavitalea sp. CAU 1676]MDF2193557.1 DUF2268 domain-containing putative Zn-dependent protease [Paraflavitalea sp. CAU 1676]
MRKVILSFCIVFGLVDIGQSQTYRYADQLYYQSSLYLNTPWVYLNAAASRAQAGDTATAVSYIQKAATMNLYDTGYVTGDGRIKFVCSKPNWAGIRKTILANRMALGNPDKMEVVTSDINNFWKVFDKVDEPGADKRIMEEYILKGSPGLRTFFDVRMRGQVSRIMETMRKRKKYLTSIRPVTLQLHALKPRMIEAARTLKALYPAAIFPPTTFSIGTFGAFGTADGYAGQLIGAEFLCDTNTVNREELNDRERMAIADTSTLLAVLIHELIHVEQQTASDNSLLALSINEGAADFITHLVLGYHLNNNVHAYGNAHEKELWTKFKTQMTKDNTDDWLYNSKNAQSGAPGDLGYYMGYKICEAYYEKAADKRQAVKDILTIPDFQEFLQASGYDAGN